jgi:hypothetical protein
MLDGSPSVFAIGGVSNFTAKIVLLRAVDELVVTTADKPVGDAVELAQVTLPWSLESATMSFGLDGVIRKPASDWLWRSTLGDPNWRNTVEGSDDSVLQLSSKTISLSRWFAEKH